MHLIQKLVNKTLQTTLKPERLKENIRLIYQLSDKPYSAQKRESNYIKYFLYSAGLLISYKLYKNHFPTVTAISIDGDRRKQFNFVADVVENSAPAVVYIEIKDTRFNFFTGQPVAISNGSGFIVKENGLILTNAHVVTNKPHCKVEVRLHNGTVHKGIVEDVDMQSDLATVRINAKNLPVLKLGNSSDLRSGEFVIAMGAPLSLSNSATFGVISSAHRGSDELGLIGKNMDYLQTDAAITFGNSGGPLLNLNGEAIGVNSMKVTAGISFAIPSDYVRKFLDNAKGSSKMLNTNRRYMGITMLSLTPQILAELQHRGQTLPKDIRGGVLVWKVIIGSPAYSGGLQPGDIVTHIDEKPVSNAEDVYAILAKSSDARIKLNIFRSGMKMQIYVMPENME